MTNTYFHTYSYPHTHTHKHIYIYIYIYIYMHLKVLITLFQKMIWFIDVSATDHEILAIKLSKKMLIQY